MKIKALIAFVMFTGVLFGQTTTYTGTVKDLSGSVVTSGNVTFTLTPSVDTTISGTSRFTPNTVNCTINGSGALVANDGVSACVVTQNTALTPTGTSYTICIQPYFTSPGSCFVDYAVTSSKDISTVAPTPQLSPNYPITGVLFGTQNTWTAAQTGPFIDKGGAVYNIDAYSSASDWCKRVMDTDVVLGANAGEIQVGPTTASTASCSVPIALQANHTLRFTRGGTYVLGSQNIAPAGSGTAVICPSWGTILSYTTGAGYAYDILTQPKSRMDGCAISIGTSALGAIRIRHNTNANEANNTIKRVFASAAVYSATQIGLLLQADNATSSNYHNDIDIQTLNIGIGTRLVSLVNNQGPNANTLKIGCNGHLKCLDVMDGSDEIVSGMVLGAQGLTGGTAINLCGAGNGGYGTSNNVFGPLSTEQGGTSTSINVNSGAGLTVGCGNSLAFGQFNDTTQFADANTPSTVAVISQGGAFRNLIVANNNLCFGGLCSAASTAIVRNGTIVQDMLGDQSALARHESLLYLVGFTDTGLSRGAAGQVNVGNGTAGDASGTINYSAVKLNGVTLASATAPTITSGFGTSPSLTANGTAAVMLNVGTGGTASSGTITMPFTAAHGWSCSVNNINASVGNRADNTVQISYTTTNVTVQNQTKSTGVGVAWTASDVVLLNCGAF